MNPTATLQPGFHDELLRDVSILSSSPILVYTCMRNANDSGYGIGTIMASLYMIPAWAWAAVRNQRAKILPVTESCVFPEMFHSCYVIRNCIQNEMGLFCIVSRSGLFGNAQNEWTCIGAQKLKLSRSCFM